MGIIALVFLITGKVASIKGLITASIVLSSACLVLNLIISGSTVGMIIDAILLTLSIIFRVGM